MRCHVCDYCDEGVGSLYRSGVKTSQLRENQKVILDEKTGLPICTMCMIEVKLTIGFKEKK